VGILLFKGRAKMKTFLLSAVIMTSAFSAHAVFDASSLRLKVYKMAVSSSPDCSNPTVVVSNSSPSYTNFKTNPTLGSGNVADGNYPCVIIEFSDNIKILTSNLFTARDQNTYAHSFTPIYAPQKVQFELHRHGGQWRH
jgi:hypothetical protein